MEFGSKQMVEFAIAAISAFLANLASWGWLVGKGEWLLGAAIVCAIISLVSFFAIVFDW